MRIGLETSQTDTRIRTRTLYCSWSVAVDHDARTDIDKVVLTSFGPRFANLGPLEYLDFVGIDHVARIQGYLYGDLDRTPGQQPVMLCMVQDGALGAKVGKGFFDWSGRSVDDLRDRRDMEFLRRMKEEKKAAENEASKSTQS